MASVPGDAQETGRERDELAAVDRLLLFTDAVVAIAMTLLVLPLVDLAGEDGSVGDIWRDHRGQFIAFGVSFAVIAGLWVGHHSRLRGIPRTTAALVWADMLWLATIVFLPFTTELLGGPRSDETATHVAYVASVLACTLSFNLLKWVLSRLLDEEGRGFSLVAGWVPVGLVALALLLVATVPRLGLWPMALLFLSAPGTSLVERWTTGRAPEA